MEEEIGESLEIVFSVVIDDLGKDNLEVVYAPAEKKLYFFNHGVEIGRADTSHEAGKLFTKALQEN